MSRTKNTYRNFIWTLLGQIIVLGFGFIIPRIVIATYGSEVYGLTSTINQILNLLNLLQAGAVGASIFAMFKPVAENDFYEISLILSTSKKYFHQLGKVFLGLVFLAGIAFLLNENSNFTNWEILFSFTILGLNASYSFFFIYKYDILFSSFQKRYILSISGNIEKLIYYLLLFIILHFEIYFLFMYVAVMVGTTIKVIYLNIYFKKRFQTKLVKIESNENFKIRNKGYHLVNQIASISVESFPTILISLIFNFNLVGIFSVYYLFVVMIKTLFNLIQMSISEVFGNLIAQENDERIGQVFNLILFVFFSVGIIVAAILSYLIIPFISLYTQGLDETNYIFPELGFSIILFSIAYGIYMPFYTLSNNYGLYPKFYKQSIVSGILGILISFILAIQVSFSLVFYGVVFYYLTSTFYRVYVLNKELNWFRIEHAIIRAIFYFGIPVAVFIKYYSAYKTINTWDLLIINSSYYLITIFGFIILYTLLFERDIMSAFRKYIYQVFKH